MEDREELLRVARYSARAPVIDGRLRHDAERAEWSWCRTVSPAAGSRGRSYDRRKGRSTSGCLPTADRGPGSYSPVLRPALRERGSGGAGWNSRTRARSRGRCPRPERLAGAQGAPAALGGTAAPRVPGRGPRHRVGSVKPAVGVQSRTTMRRTRCVPEARSSQKYTPAGLRSPRVSSRSHTTSWHPAVWRPSNSCRTGRPVTSNNVLRLHS